MRLLLTSAGIKNKSIHDALVDLLGKPIAESNAVFIPTAMYRLPGGAAMAWRSICGLASTPFCELGWKSMGVLELTALPSIKRKNWVPVVQQTDALLVGGGDCPYLSYWMRGSGLADLLPSLWAKTVYAGLSAGSMVVIPTFGENFAVHEALIGADKGLGLVDFSLLPHLDHERFPENSLTNLERVAASIPAPTYAIDDQTAIKVTDSAVEVVSEGRWKLFRWRIKFDCSR